MFSLRLLDVNFDQKIGCRHTYNELLSSVQEKKPDARITSVIVERMYHNPDGRELLLGAIRDPVFGPVITFGAGGVFVEVIRDRATALPPLNTFIIDDLIERSRVAELLGSFRNLPAVNRPALKHVLRRLSEIVCELPLIRELDINPIVVDEEGAVVLDARIVVDIKAPSIEPYDHMAIYPYPYKLVSHMQLADGTDISIRPIRPEDAEIEQLFVHNLSPQSKYFRFMQALHELTPQMLVRFTQIDYDREMALIAVTKIDGKEVEIGVARYMTNPDGESCEFAIVVADEWHKKGIGSHLISKLLQIARARGFKEITGEVSASNRRMLDLASSYGFTLTASKDELRVMNISKEM